MTSYITQIIETGQKLCGTGFAITDEWIGSLLLAGLSDKFKPMIKAIEHSGIEIIADVIKTKLMDMSDNVGGTEQESAILTSKGCQKKQNILAKLKLDLSNLSKLLNATNVNKPVIIEINARC